MVFLIHSYFWVLVAFSDLTLSFFIYNKSYSRILVVLSDLFIFVLDYSLGPYYLFSGPYQIVLLYFEGFFWLLLAYSVILPGLGVLSSLLLSISNRTLVLSGYFLFIIITTAGSWGFVLSGVDGSFWSNLIRIKSYSRVLESLFFFPLSITNRIPGLAGLSGPLLSMINRTLGLFYAGPWRLFLSHSYP